MEDFILLFLYNLSLWYDLNWLDAIIWPINWVLYHYSRALIYWWFCFNFQGSKIIKKMCFFHTIIQKNQLRNTELRLPYIGPILKSFWCHHNWSPQFGEVNVSLQRGKETHVPFPSCELLFCLAPHVSDGNITHEGASWLKWALCLDEQVGLGKSLWFGNVEGEVLQDKGKRSLRENRTYSSWAPWRRRTDGSWKLHWLDIMTLVSAGVHSVAVAHREYA